MTCSERLQSDAHEQLSPLEQAVDDQLAMLWDAVKSAPVPPATLDLIERLERETAEHDEPL